MQTLYKHYEYGNYGNDTNNKCDFGSVLKVCLELMSSLWLANCFMFVPRQRETLGRRQWTVA